MRHLIIVASLLLLPVPAMAQTSLSCGLGLLVFAWSDFLPTSRFATSIADIARGYGQAEPAVHRMIIQREIAVTFGNSIDLLAIKLCRIEGKAHSSRNIGVEAKGEVEGLKDTINQMITNLRETTLQNQEQDWLKSNLAKFGQMLQGQRDLQAVTQRTLSELAQVVNAHYGAFYILKQAEDTQQRKLSLFSAYGYRSDKNIPKEFENNKLKRKYQ
jgi:hypothetical protein